MPVKIYVSRDSQGQPWPPDHSHEALAAIEIIKRLWLAFDHQETLYAVVANLHRPSADLVIISERGVGVLELKHYPGRVSQKPDSAWYAGRTRIKAGAESKGYRNPHEQVQAYAEHIRGDLIHLRRPPPWLPGRIADWEKFKFQTAVCFTHPDALIDDFKEALRHRHRPVTHRWEKFDVLKPDEIPEWTAALRFEVDTGHRHGFEPHRLTPQQIIRIAARLLGGTEWTEIANLMPTSEPYAYLTLIEDGRRMQVFGLDREEITVGRDANTCAVPVPERFSRVGRTHARITRSVQGIFIEDLDSMNGTYINGLPIRRGKRRRLAHGQKITLGGRVPSSKVCLLQFSLQSKAVVEPASTEISSELEPDVGRHHLGT
ncbi:MAG: FHA domain-containing protein [Chloroflexi bacterium]|nr:FHA domain-containing protein [Chloroflexota bacterium]